MRQYFNWNERLEMFLTCFCNILCYVDRNYYLKRGKYTFRIAIWRQTLIFLIDKTATRIKIFVAVTNKLEINNLRPVFSHCTHLIYRYICWNEPRESRSHSIIPKYWHQCRQFLSSSNHARQKKHPRSQGLSGHRW